MTETSQNKLDSIRIQQGSETKLVVKQPSVGCEFAQLPVSVIKYPWMCSVQGSMGEGESSISCQDTERRLSRATTTFRKVA